MIASFLTLENLISLLTLTLMEIVLGIDNVVFISILCAKLPQDYQDKARKIGIALAFVARSILLVSISWLVGMTMPLIVFQDISLSARDIILILGGLFLLYKSTLEIHSKVDLEDEEDEPKPVLSFKSAIIQIILIDIIFSFDSILTAVGLVNQIPIMIMAVMISMVLMYFYAQYISDFIEKHPSIKMLALSFLLMIGLMLVLEGFKVHVPKGYIYFAMLFALIVEWLNIRSIRIAREKKIVKRQKKMHEDELKTQH